MTPWVDDGSLKEFGGEYHILYEIQIATLEITLVVGGVLQEAGHEGVTGV